MVCTREGVTLRLSILCPVCAGPGLCDPGCLQVRLRVRPGGWVSLWLCELGVCGRVAESRCRCLAETVGGSRVFPIVCP